MISASKKFFALVIVTLFLLTLLGSVPLSQNSGQVVATPAIPPTAFNEPIYIHNNLSTPVKGPFNEMVVVNSSKFSSYETANLSNVFFSNNTNAIPSWLESGNSRSDNNTTYWLRINNTLAPHSTLVLYLSFEPESNIAFNNYSTGEAPQLSNIYGQYDNGASIFPFYSNFAGTSLNSSIWFSSKTAAMTVNNGITFNHPSYIWSKAAFNSPSYAESYGVMNNPSTNGSTSYIIGGVGFSANGMNGTNPDITSGWAENDTNGLGLTVYNGFGPYTINVSKSINPNNYHVFGTGFINDTYTTISVDNKIQNSSSISLKIPTYETLNASLGYQTNDFPQTNHFYWIFVRNTTSNGLNLPYSVGGYNVNFVENGLPSGQFWGVNIFNITNLRPNGGITTLSSISDVLPNGVYNYTVYSNDNAYVATIRSSNFTVSSASVTIDINFVPYTNNVTFKEFGLPSGSSWSANVSGNIFTSTTSVLYAPVSNGTYSASFSSAGGYISYPTNENFTVSGASENFDISFESPANATYIRTSSTILPFTNTTSRGYLNQLDYNTVLSSITQNTQGSQLYYAEFGISGSLVGTLNVTTGQFKDSYQNYAGTSCYYDPVNGLLYTGFSNGTIIAFNPSDFKPVHVINVSSLSDSFFSIVPSTSSNLLYALGFNTSVNNSEILYAFTPNGTITGKISFDNITPRIELSILGPGVPQAIAPPVTDNYLVQTNSTGVLLINTTTGKETFITAPSGFNPFEPVPYGQKGNFIIGNYSGRGSLIFNISSKTLTPGPNLPGTVTASAYDSLSGLEFLSYYPFNYTSGVSSGGISAVYANNNTVVATAPSPLSAVAMVFDPYNQILYSQDSIGTTGAVHAYSVEKAYSVTVKENGLPSGSTWYTNITGQPGSGPLGSSSTHKWILVNGTYSYVAGTTDKNYKASGQTFSVSGSDMVITVNFVPFEFNVTFHEKGLPAGTVWSVSVNGQEFNSSSSSLTVSLMNGSYSYVVSNDTGFTITNQTATFNVSGSAVTENIVFSKHTGGISTLEIGLIGGGIVVAVGAVAGVSLWRRKNNQ